MDLPLPLKDTSSGNPGRTRVTSWEDGPKGRGLDAWSQHLGQGLGPGVPARMLEGFIGCHPNSQWGRQPDVTHPPMEEGGSKGWMGSARPEGETGRPR